MTSVTGPLAPPAPALDVRAAAELRRRRVLESGEERLRKITSRLRADDATAAHASGAAALHTPETHPPCAAEHASGGEAGAGGRERGLPWAQAADVSLPTAVLPREDALPGPVDSVDDGDEEEEEEDDDNREDWAASQEAVGKQGGGLGVEQHSSGGLESQPGVPPTPGGTPSATPGGVHASRPGGRPSGPGGGHDRVQAASGLDWSGLGAGRLAPEVRRLEAVHGALSATRRPRLGASLLLAVLHAQQQTPQQLLQMTPGHAQPSPLVVFLAMEVFLLAGGAVVLPPGEAPRVGGPGDIGWLSLLSVAGTLVPPARKALTYTRALLAVFVALLDDGAVFVLALLLWRAYLAERGGA